MMFIISLMHQAPLTPAVCVDTLGVSHPPFPAHAVLFPRTISHIMEKTQKPTPRKSVDVVTS